MFTGLIQRIGIVRRVSRGAGLVLEIEADVPWPRPLEPGESVAVNGACLTVARCAGSRFTADVLRETEERTGLAELLPGAKVNLERAVRAGEALGGHIVQGHVDCRGQVLARTPSGRDFRLKVRVGRVLAASSVLKGSVTLDGVSLTISDIGDDWLAVDVIPTTARETTLGAKRLGDGLNVEGDIVGKYVAKAVRPPEGPAVSNGLTEESLARAGFL